MRISSARRTPKKYPDASPESKNEITPIMVTGTPRPVNSRAARGPTVARTSLSSALLDTSGTYGHRSEAAPVDIPGVRSLRMHRDKGSEHPFRVAD